VIEGVDSQPGPAEVFLVVRWRHHPVVHERQVRIVDLHEHSRSMTYCSHPMPLPNSPSLTMSIPAWTCRRTTSSTAVRSAASKPRTSRPDAFSCSSAANSAGLTRLPT
jgi:hypothetical protein